MTVSDEMCRAVRVAAGFIGIPIGNQMSLVLGRGRPHRGQGAQVTLLSHRHRQPTGLLHLLEQTVHGRQKCMGRHRRAVGGRGAPTVSAAARRTPLAQPKRLAGPRATGGSSGISISAPCSIG